MSRTMTGLSAKERYVFILHAATLLAAVAYILPLDLMGIQIKDMAFSIMVWCSILACGYTLYANYGAPPVWPWRGMEVLAPWIMRVQGSNDMQMLFFALIFVSSEPMLIVALILARRSLWSVGTMGSTKLTENRFWKMFSPVWTTAQANQVKIMQYATTFEIGLGFMLVAMLLTPSRKILAVFLMWNFLKMRYISDKSGRHRNAWAQIDARVSPYLNKVPMLTPVVNYAKNWFTTSPMDAARAQ